ncbi:MAG: fluoride efflux transporter CrcB [Pyrinomonadaceae bacterium]
METLTRISAVAVGGAVGAVTRYLINISPLQNFLKPFPLPTFFINISGSFLIGFLLIILTDKFTVNENLRVAILVGFLGAYTTFSTFELEIFALIKEQQYVTAFAYLLLSVLVGFAGVALGVWLAKQF